MQDQIQRQLEGVGKAQQDAADFAAEAERAAKEREARMADLDAAQKRRSQAVRIWFLLFDYYMVLKWERCNNVMQ